MRLVQTVTSSLLVTALLVYSQLTNAQITPVTQSPDATARPVVAANPESPTTAMPRRADAQDIAGKLTNPVAAMISVPFQFNYNQAMGLDQKGSMTSLTVQPVVPISLNADWNLIARPIMTGAIQNNIDGLSGTGVSPVLLETFFSPTTSSRTIWGVGPFLSTPSLSGSQYGTKQWGAGISAVGLIRPGQWTIGMLGYQSWNVSGSGTPAIDPGGTANNTYWQPFISYVTKNAWTYGVNTESSFNWDTRRAANPMNATVSKLVFIGEMPVSFTLGARYYLSSVPGGASGWGARLSVTFVFPE